MGRLEGRWLTWANLLSAARLACIPPAVLAVLGGHWYIAAACFTTAVATDFLDGPVARRRGDASPLGGLLDHTTDAAFVSATLAALAMAGIVTPILPILVVVAFVQYVVDSRALDGRSLRTSWLGRSNGIAYYVMAGIPIIADALRLGWPPRTWIMALSWLLVITTVVSMAERGWVLIRSNRRVSAASDPDV